jgi:hypothetical protein
VKRLRNFWPEEQAAAAAEFALVLPAALLLMLGTIDVGRWAWTLNEVEKATQIGARHAVVTNLVAAGLNTADFGEACGGLIVGDTIECNDAFPAITCDGSGCSCAGGGCDPVDADAFDETAFTAILQRMRTIAPYIGAGNISITYQPSGIGYYGDPFCLGVQSSDGCSTGEFSDVAPIVTVNVSSVQFRPITFGLFSGGITIPVRSYSLTLEDGYGTAAS